VVRHAVVAGVRRTVFAVVVDVGVIDDALRDAARQAGGPVAVAGFVVGRVLGRVPRLAHAVWVADVRVADVLVGTRLVVALLAELPRSAAAPARVAQRATEG